jgi:hypothetical protein
MDQPIGETHVVTDLPDVTRVEVIDGTGRAFVRYYDTPGVQVHVQDEGRTIKVFTGDWLGRDHQADMIDIVTRSLGPDYADLAWTAPLPGDETA